MKNFILANALFCLLTLFLTGCGDPSVSGKVLFSDGSPVTKGKVYFEKDGFSATGTIQEDGSYKMGTIKESSGVPLGKYKIAIMGAVTQNVPDDEGKVNRNTGVIVRKPILFQDMVDKKYTSVSTSGLEIEVEGSMKHDIIVEPPAK